MWHGVGCQGSVGDVCQSQEKQGSWRYIDRILDLIISSENKPVMVTRVGIPLFQL